MTLMRMRRNNRGGTLALVTAILVGIMFTLLFFFAHFTRILGAHQQQSTAIDAAALASAVALGKITIEDPFFGFIGLSDGAPSGQDTKAGDGYCLPVTGINSLLGTVRLDLIIADQLQDDIMRQCAQRDYQNALKARDRLVAALNDSITQGFGRDVDGNVVDPLKEAMDAYLANRVNMTGGKSRLIPGSMKLTLGFVEGLPSNLRIPQPDKFAQINASWQDYGYYKANMDIPYQNSRFFFASLSNGGARLVDHKKFVTTLPNMRELVPTIVKCEADHEFQENDNFGRPLQRTVHIVAAGEPGGFVDPRSHAGIFAIHFVDGIFPEIATLGSLRSVGQITNAPTDLLESPATADFPNAPLQEWTMPLFAPDKRPLVGKLMSVAFYDWIRRAGPGLNVQSLLDTLNKPLNSAGNVAEIHLFDPNGKGLIDYSVKPLAEVPGLPVSHKQWRATSGLAVKSANNKFFDTYIRDFVHQPGRVAGGIHAGEPFPYSTANQVGQAVELQLLDERINQMFTFPQGSGARPTYTTSGLAVVVKFKAR